MLILAASDEEASLTCGGYAWERKKTISRKKNVAGSTKRRVNIVNDVQLKSYYNIN